MRVELINRLERLEACHGRARVARIDRIRLVGIGPDGVTEVCSAILKLPPIKNGRADFSKAPDDELRQIARLRIVETD